MMIGVSAHIDGAIVVPDEPLPKPANEKVVVLIESAGAASLDNLEKATREYYQASTGEEWE